MISDMKQAAMDYFVTVAAGTVHHIGSIQEMAVVQEEALAAVEAGQQNRYLEPATLLLMGFGIGVTGLMRFRKRGK